MFNEFSYPQHAHTIGLGTTMSTNPFGEPTGFSAAERYPEIAPETQPQSQGWQPQQQSSNRTGSTPLHPDVFPGGGNWTPGPPVPPGWQPSIPQIPHNSQFYQLMQAHAQVGTGGTPTGYSGSPTNFLPPSQGYAQTSQYNPSDSTGYANPTVAQFDPFNNSTPQSQTWGHPGTPQSHYGSTVPNVSSQSSSQYSATNYSPTPSTEFRAIHPREYVQKNRIYLENWDQYHWKQALNSFDTLEEAWRNRLQQLQIEQSNQRSRYGVSDPTFDQLIRAAQSNRDAITSCKLQMNEVKTGYNLSSNPASKQLVREALNAGLKDLPGWP